MRRLEKASFVVGLLMLGWLIVRIGPERVGRNLADLGWGFVLLFLLQAILSALGHLVAAHAAARARPPAAMWRMLISCGHQRRQSVAAASAEN
jgi:hypothetical protein